MMVKKELVRFDAFRATYDEALDVDVRLGIGSKGEEVRAALDLVPVRHGCVATCAVEGQPLILRPPERVGVSKRVGVALMSVRRGVQAIAIGGREHVVRAGELCLLPGVEPFVARLSPSYEQILYLTPVEALPPYLGSLLERAPQVVNGRVGFGSVLALQLAELAVHGPIEDPDAERHIDAATQHLLGAVFGAADATTTSGLRAQTLRELHRQRVLDVIAQHFGDPELGPQKIAQRCRISVRYVHCLFAGEPSVTERLIDHRLGYAYALLVRGAAERRQSIGEIARASGFSSFSHFCRSFKKRFGVTPREARSSSPSVSPNIPSGPAARR